MTAEFKEVVIYTTLLCPFCLRAKRFLENKKVSYKEISVDRDRVKRQEMIQKSKRLTVPQIWVGNIHVGGWDELSVLDRAGKLDSFLANSTSVSETE